MTLKPSGIQAAACGFALLLAVVAPAGAEEALRIKAIIEGQAGTGFTDGNRPMPITIHLTPEKSRIDFNQRGAESIYMLVDEQTRRGWLVDSGLAQAMPAQARGFSELLVDPQQPCQGLGVQCRQIPARMIAGVRAQGWRYLGAGLRGPGGTARGEFWVDPARGLILGYEGYRTGRSRVYKMRTMSVTTVEDAA
jgi:hypothetical protein